MPNTHTIVIAIGCILGASFALAHDLSDCENPDPTERANCLSALRQELSYVQSVANIMAEKSTAVTAIINARADRLAAISTLEEELQKLSSLAYITNNLGDSPPLMSIVTALKYQADDAERSCDATPWFRFSCDSRLQCQPTIGKFCGDVASSGKEEFLRIDFRCGVDGKLQTLDINVSIGATEVPLSCLPNR